MLDDNNFTELEHLCTPNNATQLAIDNSKCDSTYQRVKALNEADENLEWYPTSDAQISAVVEDILALNEYFDVFSRHNRAQLLEIGAGDARVSKTIQARLEDSDEKITLTAIEKASVHNSQYHKDNIALVGTDFMECNLMLKQCQISFCNPPFKEFETWFLRLVNELNFNVLYVVVPQRWRDNQIINDAIKARGIEGCEILLSDTYLEADRQSRAKVDVIRLTFKDIDLAQEKADEEDDAKRDRFRREKSLHHKDSFDAFIENELGLKATENEYFRGFLEYEEKERIQESIKEGGESFELVKSEGIFAALLAGYERDIEHCIATYKALGAIEPSLLKELQIKISDVQETLKGKLYGYRNVYWSILFEKLDALSSRLTNKNKQKLLDKLKCHNLDFTLKNAVYVIADAIRYANERINNSIIETFKELTCEASIEKHYVSNERVYSDEWRYNCDENNNACRYVLDYRFIYSKGYSNFETGYYQRPGLRSEAQHFTNDIIVVAKLLGYSDILKDRAFEYMSAGDKLTISATEPDGKSITLATIRYFLNGNKHIKLNQAFMLRFNATASRLLGWCRSKEEFESEAQASISEADWAVSEHLAISHTKLLGLALQSD